jgi:anti-sigma factor RsiW
MSIQFTCDDKQTLIAYLYGEVDASTRKAVDDHLATCAACASEVTALGDVRSELGLWMAPDAELDFKIVKRSEAASNVLRPARWWNSAPVWAQAAAAVLVLAAGAAIANVQVKSGPEGFSVSTGWMKPTNAAAPAPQQATEDWKPAFTALEQQLRSEIKATREQATPVSVVSRGPADEATLKRVQQMIADAEQRHNRELATRFVEFTRDMTMQRRADLMKISQGFDDYNGQLLRQRQMLNNVIRVSATPQQ